MMLSIMMLSNFERYRESRCDFRQPQSGVLQELGRDPHSPPDQIAMRTHLGSGVYIAAVETMLIFVGGEEQPWSDADEHAQSHDWLPNAVGR
jgi:hypothetical protein